MSDEEKTSLETLCRVFDDREGVFIEVGPSADTPDSYVEVRTVGKESIDWFGPINLNLSKARALLLAEAIRKVASELA